MYGMDYLGNGKFHGVGFLEGFPSALTTEDFGSTWYQAVFDTLINSSLSDVSFADSTVGLCVGGVGQGCSYLSLNGGQFLQYINPNVYYALVSVSYPKPFIAWAITSIWGDIYRYLDISITPPESIDNLQINYNTDDTVVLNWSPVNLDIFGNNITVEGYDVYRDINPYFEPEPLFLIGNTVDTVYVDSTVSVGFEDKYFYRVISWR